MPEKTVTDTAAETPVVATEPAAPAAPALKFVEVEVVRKCVPTYLRTHDADGMPYTGEPTPFDEQGNPVRQGGDKLGTIPPGINFMMEAREAVHFQRARVVLPTYSSIS